MTTYAELVESVAAITNRPALVREMKVAIRKAIFKFHLADTFKRDLNTVNLDMSLYPSDIFRWTMDLSNATAFPRFRKPSFLQIPPPNPLTTFYNDPNQAILAYPGGLPKDRKFTFIAADNIFDDYAVERTNYFTQVGMSLNISATFAPTILQLGYYMFPSFVDDSGNISIISWIADQFQDAISEEAASTVFKMIGKDDESARYQALFAENIQMVRGIDLGEEGH